MSRHVFIVFLVSLLAISGRAAAWGSDGHSIVAAIAEERLGPEVKALVRELVGDTPLSSPEIASWDDKVPGPSTRPWHYVNTPFTAAHYDPQRDCSRDACVVAAIERNTAVLGNATASISERTDALRWLVHLVGDIHQPLHAGDGLDRGGNEQPVRIGKRKQPTNLHRVWDIDVVAPLVRQSDPVTVARTLGRDITADDAHNWTSDMRPSPWAEQSNAEARDIYAKLDRRPTDRTIFRVPAKYPTAQRDRVQLVLKRAGVRLAAVLEEVARNRATQRSP